jgi:hypothetical protein
MQSMIRSSTAHFRVPRSDRKHFIDASRAQRPPSRAPARCCQRPPPSTTRCWGGWGAAKTVRSAAELKHGDGEATTAHTLELLCVSVVVATYSTSAYGSRAKHLDRMPST